MPLFYENNPGIEVTYVPQSDDVDVKLLAQMVAGEAPDLMFGCCTWFPIIAQKGQLLDLRPYVEADLDPALVEDFDPAQYNALFLPDGTQYALPKYKRRVGLVLQQGPLRRVRRGVSARRGLDPGRVSGRHAEADGR